MFRLSGSHQKVMAVMLCSLLAQLGTAALASASDVSGTWESEYNFGDMSEVMTAKIQQVGESIIGSYVSVQSPSGEENSGVLFGTIVGDKIKVYYLGASEGTGKDPRVDITYTDARLIDGNTIRGTYYYRDSDQAETSGDYEARRV